MNSLLLRVQDQAHTSGFLVISNQELQLRCNCTCGHLLLPVSAPIWLLHRPPPKKVSMPPYTPYNKIALLFGNVPKTAEINTSVKLNTTLLQAIDISHTVDKQLARDTELCQWNSF
jgi:hypothetical protein